MRVTLIILDQYQLPIRRNFEYLEKICVFKFFKSLYLQVFRASWIHALLWHCGRFTDLVWKTSKAVWATNGVRSLHA